MEEVRSISSGDSFQRMRANLEEYILLVEQKRVGYDIGIYAGSEDVPSVVTCFAACPSEAVASELHARICDLIRSCFPTVSKSPPDQAN
jgi:hypothetical protein